MIYCKFLRKSTLKRVAGRSSQICTGLRDFDYHRTTAWITRHTEWLIVFVFWTIVGLFFSSQIYLMINVGEGKPFPFSKALRSTLPDWYLWAFLTIPVLKLSRRYPLETKT